MRYFLLLFLIFQLQNLTAQDAAQIQSLKSKIESTSDTEQLKHLVSLCQLTQETTFPEFDSFAELTIKLAFELNDLEVATHQTLNRVFHMNNIIGKPKNAIPIYLDYKAKAKDYESKAWTAFLYNDVGDSYYFSGNVDTSIIYYNRAITIAKKHDIKRTQGLALLYMSSPLIDQGKFAEGSQALQEASSIFIEVKDTFHIISTKTSLAILYSQNSFFEEAENERNEAIELAKKTKNIGKLASLHFNAAADNKKQGYQNKRIQNLKLAWDYAQKSQYVNFYEPTILSSLVVAYAQNDSIKQAMTYLKQLELKPEQNTKGRSEETYLEALKFIAFAKKNYKEAEKYGLKDLKLDQIKKSFEAIQESEQFLAKVYEKLGYKEKAYEHFQNYSAIKDSITSVKKVRALSYYQTIYETEKRDLKIKAQESDIALLDAKHKLKNQWFLIAGILAVLFFTAITLRNRYQRKLEKRVAIENLRNKISHDLHDDVGSILTGLAMQTEILEMQAHDDSKPKLRKISDLSRSAMSRMRDAVWAMDTGKDNWRSLIDRMNEFALETLTHQGIQFEFKHHSINQEKELTTQIRQNFYLIFKEAITNIIKHSNGDKVEVLLEENKLSIWDNGQVKYKSYKTAGLGLSSMQKRAETISGRLEISQKDGFEVIVKI